MVLVGTIHTEGEMPSHIDDGDVINAVVSIGSNSFHGGTTFYLDGVCKKNHGKVIHEVPFVNGRVKIGCYNNVYHGAFPYTNGPQGTINFC